MREDKKKRLEAKGWKFGDAAEFLGLTRDQAAIVDARLRRAARAPHESPTDGDLVRAADQVFQELDDGETDR